MNVAMQHAKISNFNLKIIDLNIHYILHIKLL
jgi:hypothetical protein